MASSNYQEVKQDLDEFIIKEKQKLLSSVSDSSIVLSKVEQAILDLHLLIGEQLDYPLIYKLSEINPELYERVQNINKKTFLVLEKMGYDYSDSVLSLKNRLEIRMQVNELFANEENINAAARELKSKGVRLTRENFKESTRQYLISNLRIFDHDLYTKIYGYRRRDEGYTFPQKVKDLTGYNYEIKAERFTEDELCGWVIAEINKKENRQRVIDLYSERGIVPDEHAIDVFILEHIGKFDEEVYSKLKNFVSHRGLKVEDFFINNGFGSEGRKKKKLSIREHFSRLVSKDGLRSVRDKDGFVNSFRRNSDLKRSVQFLAQKFNVPPAVVVELMCGEKLKGVYLEVDYVDLTRNMLVDYLKAHDNSLDNLRGEPIYDRLNYIKSRISREDDSDYTIIDVVKFLLDDYDEKIEFGSLRENNFVSGKDLLNQVKSIFDTLKENEGNEISSTKFRYMYPSYHRKLRIFAYRIGTTVEDLFDIYGMKYVVIKSGANQRMAKTKMGEIPCLNEMKEIVEEEMLSRDFSKVSEDEMVETYLSICKDAYLKFQPKMFNGSSDTKDNIEDELEK